MKNKAEILRINEKGTTNLYVPYKEYKELKKSYDELLRNKEVKEPKKEIKLHDLVNYQGYEWYVIKLENNEATLMMKNTIKDINYSDDNSNGWENSKIMCKVIQFANDNLNKNDLLQMITNYDENKYSYDLIRIPTIREIEALPMNIRNCGNTYWTMTASYGVSEDCSGARVFRVSSTGSLGYNYVVNAYGVRPVIKLNTDKL